MWRRDFDWYHFRPPRSTLTPETGWGVELGGHNWTLELRPNGSRWSKTLYWEVLGSRRWVNRTRSETSNLVDAKTRNDDIKSLALRQEHDWQPVSPSPKSNVAVAPYMWPRQKMTVGPAEREEYAKDTTGVSVSTLVMRAPGEVNPGHIMLAPLRMNLMAPLSTCMWGIMNGSAQAMTHNKLTVSANEERGCIKNMLQSPQINCGPKRLFIFGWMVCCQAS